MAYSVIADAIRDRLQHSALTHRPRELPRHQSQETCLMHKGRVKVSLRGSAGSPCNVGPIRGNRVGPLHEILQHYALHYGQRKMAGNIEHVHCTLLWK
jgi:hypothetical protein